MPSIVAFNIESGAKRPAVGLADWEVATALADGVEVVSVSAQSRRRY